MDYNTINADWKITSQPLPSGVKDWQTVVPNLPLQPSDHGAIKPYPPIGSFSRSRNICGLAGEYTSSGMKTGELRDMKRRSKIYPAARIAKATAVCDGFARLRRHAGSDKYSQPTITLWSRRTRHLRIFGRACWIKRSRVRSSPPSTVLHGTHLLPQHPATLSRKRLPRVSGTKKSR